MVRRYYLDILWVKNGHHLNVTSDLVIVADHIYPVMSTVYLSSDGYMVKNSDSDVVWTNIVARISDTHILLFEL